MNNKKLESIILEGRINVSYSSIAEILLKIFSVNICEKFYDDVVSGSDKLWSFSFTYKKCELRHDAKEIQIYVFKFETMDESVSRRFIASADEVKKFGDIKSLIVF